MSPTHHRGRNNDTEAAGLFEENDALELAKAASVHQAIGNRYSAHNLPTRGDKMAATPPSHKDMLTATTASVPRRSTTPLFANSPGLIAFKISRKPPQNNGDFQ